MKHKPDIVLIGGGGHCHAVIDVIEQENRFSIKGILDNILPLNKDVLDYKVIGTDRDIPDIAQDGSFFLVTVGQIKSYNTRLKLANLLLDSKCAIASVISPRAYISRYSRIGEGTVVMHNAIINANVTVGNHCIINTNAEVEHDSIIEDFCHVSTGAIVNGNCTVRKGSFLGSNSTISNGKTIFENSVIGAGSFYK